PVPKEIFLQALTSTHEISLSTASLINLLSEVTHVLPLTQSLFRHPLREVRLSVINLVRRSLISGKMIDFIGVIKNVINNLLVEEDECLVNVNKEILLLMINYNNNII